MLGLGGLQFVLDGGPGAGDGGPTGTGGAGCTDAAECPPAPAGLCASLGTVTCINGTCGVTYQAGPSPSQKYGSCKTNWCDATGMLSRLVDAGNVFVDTADPCIQYPCINGVPVLKLLQNTPCLRSDTTMG